MIKVELTKNVFNQRGGGLFGLKPIQIVFAVIAMAVGGATVLWLMQYGLSIDLIGWIVFIEMTIIEVHYGNIIQKRKSKDQTARTS